MNEYEEILQTLDSFHNKKVSSESIKALRFKIESLFTKNHLDIIALKTRIFLLQNQGIFGKVNLMKCVTYKESPNEYRTTDV